VSTRELAVAVFRVPPSWCCAVNDSTERARGDDDRSPPLDLVVNRLDRSEVVDGVRSVLARGSLVALELDYQIDLFHRFYYVRLSSRGPLRDPDRTAAGLLARLDAANAAIFSMFASVRSIVIEDEYALSAHPVRPGCAFVDDRVLRWRSVRSEPVNAAQYLRAGTHGVPLCAYLSTLDPDDIGLRAGANLASPTVGRLANSTVAMAIPDGDDDSYLLACRIEPDLTESGVR
jgi:hypothetical protein